MKAYKIFRAFVTAVKAQVQLYQASYKDFITNDTYIGGRKFSFKNHEFQEYITDLIQSNPGYTFAVSKCSQIGLSEIFDRLVLSRMATRPRTSVIISFPAKAFAQEIFKTRIDPIITDSPVLTSLLDRYNDSASVKAFHNGSIVYALGGNTGSKGTILSRPVDTVLADELDRQDMKIVSGFRSRMTHTPKEERLWLFISTPTVDGIGIDAQIKDSREVHTPWIKHDCGHEFIGDYYKHVVVPGYEGDLRLLTKQMAAKLDLSLAYLKCPECGKEVNNSNKETLWKVTHNPEGTARKIGVVLDPFVAMGFITIPDLVESSFTYESHSEFLNQGLGKTADKSDSSISINKIHFLHLDKQQGQYIYGLDLGKQCHWLCGVLRNDTTIHVERAEVIKLSELEEFMENIHKQYAFTAGVIDSQPYTDLVYKFIRKYPRLYSAIYVDPTIPKPEMWTLKMVDKHNEMVRQININKPMVMDAFANDIGDFYTFEPNTYQSLILQHLMDMRRVRDYRTDDVRYTWMKSSGGKDHFFHTGIYLAMAAKLAHAGVVTLGDVPVSVQSINADRRKALNQLRSRG